MIRDILPLCRKAAGVLIACAMIVQTARAQHIREDASRVVVRAEGEIGSIAVSSDGDLLAACEVQGLSAAIWNLTERRYMALMHDPDEICALQFVPDTHFLAIATRHSVKVWNLAPGVKAASAAKLHPLRKLPEISKAVTVFFQPDAPAVAGYEPLTNVRVRGDQDKTPLLSSIEVSPDGSRIAALASFEKEISIVVIDREASTIEWSRRMPVTEQPWPHAAFSRDGETLYTTGLGLAAWQAATGKPIYHKNPELLVGALNLSPDGRSLAGAVVDPQGSRAGLAIWHSRTGERLRIHLDQDSGPRSSVVFLPSSKLLLAAGKEPALQIWNIESGKLSIVPSSDVTLSDLASVSPSGNVLSSSVDGVVRIWPTSEAGQPVPDNPSTDR